MPMDPWMMAGNKENTQAGPSSGPRFWRLWQLCSPSLPIGSYSYSQGLEWAVAAGWIENESQVSQWILGLLGHSWGYVDVPILARLYSSWAKGDEKAVHFWTTYLFACRESAELQAEEKQQGMALGKLLAVLNVPITDFWLRHTKLTVAAMFSLAAVTWDIPLPEAALGYLWRLTESLVAAAVKLVPLGQMAGQRILHQAAEVAQDAVNRGLSLDDSGIGWSTPGLAIAGALHETQRTRLFRS